ncbi:FtsX-like permease family protein [Flexivirga oryzae]|uniref:ABC3 transporter permease C-terminal domain-containing protein n=1 Tax=Flexivirga oryzae TaxID=1794944 RepID=A0A839NA20_9MICO|nr:FtsX-like permease family protein [Flexivirga oryzae]MBB2892834.1 hypothetical protein [Flexivirga oryzae]
MTGLATIARRHRFGHTILFAVTVCLLVATAAVDPLLTRSFSHSLVTFHEQAQGVSGSQVVLQTGGPQALSIGRLRAALDPRVRAVTGAGIASTAAVASSATAGVQVRIQSTQDQCAHVHIVEGRCPQARNEVMISSAAVAAGDAATLKVGAALPVVGADPAVPPKLNPHKTMRLVGIFTASSSDSFWGGAAVAAYTPPPPPPAMPGPSEYWLTDSATFSAQPTPQSGSPTDWSGVARAVQFPVLTSKLAPDTLAAAQPGLAKTQHNIGDNANVIEALSSVYDATRGDLRQVGQIVPFLLVQLGVVLLILLVQVTSYVATVRRGEAAVLKMRGNGTGGVVRLGAQEFLPAAIVGVVAGLGLAYVVDGLVRHLWLPGSVAAQWNWIAVCAALAMALLVAVVWFLCWWTMARASISSLLRARPPRRRGARLSTPAAVLAALCLVGVVLTATKSLTGAPVQVTPVLLAGFVAIVVSVLLAPVAAWLVRRLLARRRAAAGLAVAQLGRRAGVVIAVTTLIITSALLTLSVSVFVRGADNRAARSAADVGATAVVHATVGTTTVSGRSLTKAVNSVDPRHRVFTPAVEINSSTPTSNATLGVIPSDMERIGARTGLKEPVDWSALQGKSSGAPAALVASWTTSGTVGSTVSAPTMANVDGDFRVVGVAPYIPGAADRTIVVDLHKMLAAGDRVVNVTYQVFSATQDPKQLARLDAALRRAGFASSDVQTAQQVRAGYDATATAWAMNLSIVVSALSLLAALTSVVLVAVASRADRRRDLRALRTGGVQRVVLRRATVGEFVLLALMGSVIGALTAPLAAWLTGPTMLWWSTPPAEPVTRTGFQWHAGGLAAIVLIVLLGLVGAAFGVRLARSADQHRGRRRRTAVTGPAPAVGSEQT